MAKLSKANQRRNLHFNIIHEFFFGFGIAFNDVSTIVPLFLSLLGAPLAVTGSMAGLLAILMAAPQLLSALLARNSVDIQRSTIKVHLTILPPIFTVGFVFAFLMPDGPSAWIFYYTCFILYALGIGFIIPIWTNFLKHVTDKNNRGIFLGISFIGNSIGGFIGGIVIKKLLGSAIPFPSNFGWGFIIMGFSLILSVAAYLGFKMNHPEHHPKKRSVSDFIIETKSLLKDNHNFRRYIYSRIFFTAQFPAISLYAVYSKNLFQFEVSEAGFLTAARLIAFGLGSIIAGRIGDHISHKSAMAFCFLCHVLAIVTALLAQSMAWVYGIFIFLGMAQGAYMPAAMSLVFDFAGKKGDNKMIMALIDTILCPFILISVTVGGFIGAMISLKFLFYILSISMFIGLIIIIFSVHDPNYVEPI